MSIQIVQINHKTGKQEESKKLSIYKNLLERLKSMYGESNFFEHMPEAQAEFVVKTLYDLTQDEDLAFAGFVYLLFFNPEESKKYEDIKNAYPKIKQILNDLKSLSNIVNISFFEAKFVNHINSLIKKNKKHTLDHFDFDLDTIITLDDNYDVEAIIKMIVSIFTEIQQRDPHALFIEIVCRLSLLLGMRQKKNTFENSFEKKYWNCKYWHYQNIL